MGLVMALQLQREEDGQPMRGLIPLPTQIERFVRLPASGGPIRFVALETLVTCFWIGFFRGFSLPGRGCFG